MPDSTPTIRFGGGCGQLYQAGLRIHAALNGELRDRELLQPSSLGVLVLSAAAVEGFLNELAETVLDDPDGAPYRAPQLDDYADRWQLIEECQGSVHVKFRMAREFLAPDPLERGGHLSESFRNLNDVRNGLVHIRVGTGRWIENRIEDASRIPQSLRATNILRDAPNEMNQHWTKQIQTRAAATWALETASKIVLAVLDSMLGRPSAGEAGPLMSGAREAFACPWHRGSLTP